MRKGWQWAKHLVWTFAATLLTGVALRAEPLTPEVILDRVFVSAQRAQATAAGLALTKAGARLTVGSARLPPACASGRI